MVRRREDRENPIEISPYLVQGDERASALARLRSPKPPMMPQEGTEKLFARRNCASCKKQDYGEEMIERLAGESYSPIPCKDVIPIEPYNPQPGDCPKYKPEVHNEAIKMVKKPNR